MSRENSSEDRTSSVRRQQHARVFRLHQALQDVCPACLLRCRARVGRTLSSGLVWIGAAGVRVLSLIPLLHCYMSLLLFIVQATCTSRANWTRCWAMSARRRRNRNPHPFCSVPLSASFRFSHTHQNHFPLFFIQQSSVYASLSHFQPSSSLACFSSPPPPPPPPSPIFLSLSLRAALHCSLLV